ncbi:hypothetical protein EDD90_1092 [Streptomyces sp. Ag109_O5-1]|nr:hypothetical protein EDD90_1092 [Streptomyces sp. Ag109_O5-1]
MVRSDECPGRVDGKVRCRTRGSWGGVRMTGMVGSVTRQRYDELVKQGRDWVETMSGVQWQLGDAGLEIEPMRSYGGTNPSGSEELFTVSEAIRMFAEDIGLAYSTVRNYRWVASRWPKECRRACVSHTIHKILSSIPEEQERFEAVDNPRPTRAAGPRAGRMTARSGSSAGRSTPPRASRRRWTRSTNWPPMTRWPRGWPPTSCAAPPSPRRPWPTTRPGMP